MSAFYLADGFRQNRPVKFPSFFDDEKERFARFSEQYNRVKPLDLSLDAMRKIQDGEELPTPSTYKRVKLGSPPSLPGPVPEMPIVYNKSLLRHPPTHKPTSRPTPPPLHDPSVEDTTESTPVEKIYKSLKVPTYEKETMGTKKVDPIDEVAKGWHTWLSQKMEFLADVIEPAFLRTRIHQLHMLPSISRICLEDCVRVSTCPNVQDEVERLAHLRLCPRKDVHDWLEETSSLDYLPFGVTLEETEKKKGEPVIQFPLFSCVLIYDRELKNRFLWTKTKVLDVLLPPATTGKAKAKATSSPCPYIWTFWNAARDVAPDWITRFMTSMNNAGWPCDFRCWPFLQMTSKLYADPQCYKYPYEMAFAIAIHLFNQDDKRKFLLWKPNQRSYVTTNNCVMEFAPKLGVLNVISAASKLGGNLEKIKAANELNEIQITQIMAWIDTLEEGDV